MFETRQEARGVAMLVSARFLATLAHSCCFMVGVLGTAVYTFNASVFGMAGLTLMVDIALMAGNTFGGVMVDALGPRRCLMTCLCSICALGILYFLLPESLVTLAVIGGLYILCYGAMIVCFSSLPPFVVGPASLAGANSLLSTAENAAYIVGPLLGGIISVVWSSSGCFAVLAASTALAIPFALAIPIEKPEVAHEATGGMADKGGGFAYLREGFSAVFGVPVLMTLVALSFLSFFAFGAFDPLETVYYRDVLRVGVEWTGWLNAVMGVGATLGSAALMVVSGRWQTLRSSAWLAVLVGAGTLVYVGTSSPYVAAGGMFILGAAFGAFEPLCALIAQRLSPADKLGRVMGVLRVNQRASGVIPLLVAPFLAEAFGVQAVLIAAGAIVTAMGAAFALAIAPRVE